MRIFLNGVHFLANFAVDLDEIQYVATTCWFFETHANFILHKYSRKS